MPNKRPAKIEAGDLGKENGEWSWQGALKKAQEESLVYKGFRSGFRRAICVLLEERFGPLPAWVKRRVEEEVFTSHFERMVREALIAPDLEWMFGGDVRDEPE